MKPILIFDLFHTLISFKADHIPGRSTSAILGVEEELWNQISSGTTPAGA
jgi:hypothetical protein